MLHVWTKINAEHAVCIRFGSLQFESQLGQEIFFLQNFQTDSGNHSVSYSIGTRVLSRELKRTGHEVDNSPPSSSKVNNERHYPFTPPLCFHGMERE